MQQVAGVVTLVQETRFQLVTDAGQGLLFVLGAGAPLDPQDLVDLLQQQSRIVVRYRAARDLRGNVAHALLPGVSGSASTAKLEGER